MNKNKRVKFAVKGGLFEEEDFLKDCPGYRFVPVTLPAVKRIIAIGDIHGDLELAIRSFKIAKLIDEKFNWIAIPPNTVVVQVGDQIDSCRPVPGIDCHNNLQVDDRAEDMIVMDFFNQMDSKARLQGGAVYSLFGNHELYNAEGKFNYVSYENYNNFNYVSNDKKEYKGPNGRLNAFKPGGPVACMMACTRTSVLTIGSTMFAHAGVLPILVERLDHTNFDNVTKLKYLNLIVRKWLLNKLNNESDIKNKLLFVDNHQISPFWTRVYGSIPEKENIESKQCSDSVQKILQVYKLGHLIVGHTPQMFSTLNGKGINGTCYDKETGENKLFRVDGGFSKAFKIFGDHHMIQVLEIIDDKIFNIITDKNVQSEVQIPVLDVPNEKELNKITSVYAQNRVNSKKSMYRFNSSLIN